MLNLKQRIMRKLITLAILLSSLVGCAKENIEPEQVLPPSISYWVGEYETEENRPNQRMFKFRLTEDSLYISRYYTGVEPYYKGYTDSGLFKWEGDTIMMASRANTGYQHRVSFKDVTGKKTVDRGRYFFSGLGHGAVADYFNRVK